MPKMVSKFFPSSLASASSEAGKTYYVPYPDWRCCFWAAGNLISDGGCQRLCLTDICNVHKFAVEEGADDADRIITLTGK